MSFYWIEDKSFQVEKAWESEHVLDSTQPTQHVFNAHHTKLV